MLEIVDELERAVRLATSQYYRLVILAAEPSSGKTAALQTVARRLDRPLLNVNLELSKRLLDLPRAKRSHQVNRLLKDAIAAVTGDVVLLDNLEILFDTGLEVRPLGLLQNLSRNRTIVASWNGVYGVSDCYNDTCIA